VPLEHRKTEHTYKGRTAECSKRITRAETSVSKKYVQRVLDIHRYRNMPKIMNGVILIKNKPMSVANNTRK